MGLTATASMLNSVFSGFDYLILSFFHSLNVAAGFILTPIFTVITYAGEKGIVFVLFGVILLFFKKTRKAGIAVLVGIAIAFLVNSLLIKGIVARPRPFESSDIFYQWWQAAGSFPEDTYSFPSGHVAAAAAAMMVWMMSRRNGSSIVVGILVILLMACSRMYLMCHYPSDVLFGALIGLIMGAIGYGIVSVIWNLIWSKRGGHDALVAAGYESNSTQFNIPMGAPKPARAAGTSPFAAEALNDPMNFSAGGVIGTNYNTSTFHAVSDQPQQKDTAARTTAFQAYYGEPNNTQAQQRYQEQYQQQYNTADKTMGYSTAANDTKSFKQFYDNLPETPQAPTASTTEFRAFYDDTSLNQWNAKEVRGFDWNQHQFDKQLHNMDPKQYPTAQSVASQGRAQQAQQVQQQVQQAQQAQQNVQQQAQPKATNQYTRSNYSSKAKRGAHGKHSR